MPGVAGSGSEQKNEFRGIARAGRDATELQAAAHKLTQASKRDELLRDIENLRAQIALMISARIAKI